MKKRYAAMATGVAATAAFALALGGTAYAVDYGYSQDFDTPKGKINVAFDQNAFGFGIPMNNDGSPITVSCRVTLPDGVGVDPDGVGFSLGGGYSQIVPDGHFKQTSSNVYEGSCTIERVTKLHVSVFFDDGSGGGSLMSFRVLPAPPSKMKITTYHDRIVFDPHSLDVKINGDWTIVNLNRKTYYIDTPDPAQVSGLKDSKYTILMAGAVKGDTEETLVSGDATMVTVPMGPKTKPTIKSVKITKVKVKKYFNYQERMYKYKTRYTFKVTLGKKASKTKGAYIQIKGTNGLLNAYRTLKGTGKTFSSAIEMDAPVSYKGGKVKFTAMTYSDNTYDAYSPESKAKTVKIK